MIDIENILSTMVVVWLEMETERLLVGCFFDPQDCPVYSKKVYDSLERAAALVEIGTYSGLCIVRDFNLRRLKCV